jgi:hypothetical protein
MMTIGLHSACNDAAWAVLLTTAQFFDAENRLKDESGKFLWEAEAVSTANVEGACQCISCKATRHLRPLAGIMRC